MIYPRFLKRGYTIIDRVIKGFDVLRFHCCLTGMTVSEVSLLRRDQNIAWLYEQGASKERIGVYRRRRLRWSQALVLLAAITTGWNISEGSGREGGGHEKEKGEETTYECRKEQVGYMDKWDMQKNKYIGREPSYGYILWEVKRTYESERTLKKERSLKMYNTLDECEKGAAERDRDRGEVK